MNATADTWTKRPRTYWQQTQDASLDRSAAMIEVLPKVIRDALYYGPLYSNRSLVDILDQPANPGSSHGVAAKLVRELEDALRLVRVEAPR